MRKLIRRLLRIVAVAIAMTPFALVALLVFSGTTSLVIIIPNGLWMIAALVVVPILIGLALWRSADIIR